MKESNNEVPHKVEERICQLANNLPSNAEDKEKIISRYSQNKGYQFLNPKSKLHRHFNYKCNLAAEHRAKDMQMNSQVKISMQGSLDQLSVGAMCEILKQNLRKGAQPYQPVIGQQFHQQIIFQRDEELFQKTVNLLHGINLAKLQQKNEKAQTSTDGVSTSSERIPDKIAQFRKQMTVKQDGSLGAWGGKKYEGLGVSNQFTSFRREQSLNYYQSTHQQAPPQRKKQ